MKERTKICKNKDDLPFNVRLSVSFHSGSQERVFNFAPKTYDAVGNDKKITLTLNY